MDLKTTLPSHSKSYDERMKQVLFNIRLSKRLVHFLALTLFLNLFLTYGLIFHPPPPSVRRCAEFIRAQYPELVLPSAANVPRSTDISLHNDVAAPGKVETTAIAVRSASSLDELGVMIGHNVSHHGIWDHTQLELNYSDVAIENEDSVHVFGLTRPDGTESQFSYLGNSTGNHVFKMGMGAPVTSNNSTIHGRTTVTKGKQYFAWGGVDFMVDPNIRDGGYLTDSQADWDAVLAQVS
ncbi:uncharacterized protein BP5553_04871 [Venustampulla echinocandica]|uniref:Uncharacterized protein n=1 Tax=Venustampulla echinocandica TaxID=2656787 RepID=A0A370TPJ7_9HELO|nr:uncharacterized protein BP5553_04871 [Venustampulla echinocandica]RDL37438.1 hypothetical protein BP5553_04871 [Venustampulla echinocandica]